MNLEYNLTRLESWLVEIEAKIPADELQKHFDKAWTEIRAKATIPGFRKGKAPMELVKARYGKSVEAEVFDDAITDAFRQIIAKENLKIVELGQVQERHWEPKDGLRFKITVQVEPEIELKNYKGLRVVKEVQQVTEEDVEEAIAALRERYATVRTVKGEAQKGHFVLADFQELDEAGLPIVGHKWENRYVQIGSGDFGEQFDEQMVGVKKNEERQVVMSFDKGQGSSDSQFFRVKVKKIEEKNLPELNDEWAEEIGDYKDMQELREAIRKNLERQFERKAEERMRQNLIDELIRSNPFDIAPKMIENYLDYYIEDLRKKLGRPFREDEVREEYRSDAIRALKWYLLKKKIAEVENLTVSDAELDQVIEEFAKVHNQPIHKVRRYYQQDDRLDMLREDILENKVFDILLKSADLKQVKLSGRKPELVTQ
ncbi:trigger factor [candidate division KSB1 bacterium]|nr:MAG: trigger factor [candidate division KSB1 bacterium]